MNKVTLIDSQEIEASLKKSDREYLVGNLAKEQNLNHVFDEDVEIGISDYQKDTLEEPHCHPIISEYQYILSGEIILFDLDNKKSYPLSKGDFYAVPKDVRHVQVSKANSRILFVKNKSINDKKIIKVSGEEQAWINSIWKGA